MFFFETRCIYLAECRNALHGPTPEQEMFRDRTEATLFRPRTVPVPVTVLSLNLECGTLYLYVELLTLALISSDVSLKLLLLMLNSLVGVHLLKH